MPPKEGTGPEFRKGSEGREERRRNVGGQEAGQEAGGWRPRKRTSSDWLRKKRLPCKPEPLSLIPRTH